MKTIFKNARISFADGLWKKSKAEGFEGEEKYGCDFILEPDSDSTALIEKNIEEVAKESLGKKWEKTLESYKRKDRIFLKDGEDIGKGDDPYDGYDGMKIVRARSGKPVKVVDNHKNPITEADGIIASGDYVLAVIDIREGNECIYAILKAVQFIKKGPALGGITVSDDDLGDFEDENSDDEDLGDLA